MDDIRIAPDCHFSWFRDDMGLILEVKNLTPKPVTVRFEALRDGQLSEVEELRKQRVELQEKLTGAVVRSGKSHGRLKQALNLLKRITQSNVGNQYWRVAMDDAVSLLKEAENWD